MLSPHQCSVLVLSLSAAVALLVQCYSSTVAVFEDDVPFKSRAQIKIKVSFKTNNFVEGTRWMSGGLNLQKLHFCLAARELSNLL